MLAAAEAAAAVNPVLIPARRAVAYLCERWADEAAAAAVGDRHLTARALATAALANTPQGVGPAFNDLSVTRRVIALRRDPPPPRRLAATGIVLLCGAIVAADLHATHDFVELARRLIPS
jgi:hypothetical protein